MCDVSPTSNMKIWVNLYETKECLSHPRHIPRGSIVHIPSLSVHTHRTIIAHNTSHERKKFLKFLYKVTNLHWSWHFCNLLSFLFVGTLGCIMTSLVTCKASHFANFLFLSFSLPKFCLSVASSSFSWSLLWDPFQISSQVKSSHNLLQSGSFSHPTTHFTKTSHSLVNPFRVTFTNYESKITSIIATSSSLTYATWVR